MTKNIFFVDANNVPTPIDQMNSADGDNFDFVVDGNRMNTRAKSWSAIELLKQDETIETVWSGKADQLKRDLKGINLANDISWQAVTEWGKAGAEVLKDLTKAANAGQGQLFIMDTGQRDRSYDRPLVEAVWRTSEGKDINVRDIMLRSGLGYEKRRQADSSWEMVGKAAEIRDKIARGEKVDWEAKAKAARESFGGEFDTLFGVIQIENNLRLGGPQQSSLGSRGTFVQREYLNNGLAKINTDIISRVADQLDKVAKDNTGVLGGRSLFYAAEQNPEAYGFKRDEKIETTNENLARIILVRQMAYAASLAGEESEALGTKSVKEADETINHNVNLLLNGNVDEVTGVIQATATFGQDGFLRTMDRVTLVDRVQGRNISPFSAKFWATTTNSFLAGLTQSTFVGNFLQFVSSKGHGEALKHGELWQEFAADVYQDGTMSNVILASRLAGAILGASGEVIVLSKVAGAGKVSPLTFGKLRMLAQGFGIPFLQNMNESAASPLYERSNFLRDDHVGRDTMKAVADGLQNLGTMYIADKAMEKVFTNLIAKSSVGGLLQTNKVTNLLSGNAKFDLDFVNTVIRTSARTGFVTTAADIGGNLALDYLTITGLQSWARDANLIDDDIYTATTTRMFTTDSWARLLSTRIASRAMRSVLRGEHVKALQRTGKTDGKAAGTTKYYQDLLNKDLNGQAPPIKLSNSMKIVNNISNVMFGNMMGDLDMSMRVSDGKGFAEHLEGFRNVAKTMDEQSKIQAAKEFTDLTLLRYLSHKGALTWLGFNVGANLMYGGNYLESDQFKNIVSGLGVKDFKKLNNSLNESIDQRVGAMGDMSSAIAAINSVLTRQRSGQILSKESIDSSVQGGKATVNLINKLKGLLTNNTQAGKDKFKVILLTLFNNLDVNERRSVQADIAKKLADEPTAQAVMKNLYEKDITTPYVPSDILKFNEEMGWKSKEVSEADAKRLMYELSSTLSLEDTKDFWKLSFGYDYNHRYFREAVNAIREKIKEVVASPDSNKGKYLALSKDYPGMIGDVIGKLIDTNIDMLKGLTEIGEPSKVQLKQALDVFNGTTVLIRMSGVSTDIAKKIGTLKKDAQVMSLINKALTSVRDTSDEYGEIIKSDIARDEATRLLGNLISQQNITQLGALDLVDGTRKSEDVIRELASPNQAYSDKLRKLNSAEFNPDSRIEYEVNEVRKELPNTADAIRGLLANGIKDPSLIEQGLVMLAINKFERERTPQDRSLSVEVLGVKLEVELSTEGNKTKYSVKHSIDSQTAESRAGKGIVSELTNILKGAYSNNAKSFADIEVRDERNTNIQLNNIIEITDKYYGGAKISLEPFINKAIAAGFNQGQIRTVLTDYLRYAFEKEGITNRDDVDNLINALLKRGTSILASEVSFKIGSDGVVQAITISPSVTVDGLTNYTGKEISAVTMNVEFPENVRNKEAQDRIKKVFGDRVFALSTGPSGNTLKYSVFVFNKDITGKDFGVFKDEINEIIDSLGRGDGEISRLKAAATSAQDESTFKKYMTKFAEGVMDETIRHIERQLEQVDPDNSQRNAYNEIKSKKKEKEDDTITSLKERIEKIKTSNFNDEVDRKITSINNALDALISTSSEFTKPIYQGLKDGLNELNEAYGEGRNVLSEMIQELSLDDLPKSLRIIENIRGRLDRSLSDPIKRAREKLEQIGSSDRDLLQQIISLSELIDGINQGLPSTDYLGKMMTEDNFLFKDEMIKDETGQQRLVDVKTKVLLDNLDLVKKNKEKYTSEVATEDQKQEFFFRILNQGEASAFVDYAAKRRSYGFRDAGLEQALIDGLRDEGGSLAIGYANFESGDGATVMSSKLMNILDLKGSQSGGKVANKSKNMVLDDKMLTSEQLGSLLNTDAFSHLRTSYSTGAALKEGIRNGDISLLILTPQSYKSLSLDILDKLNNEGGSGLIRLNNIGNSELGMLTTKFATHTYLMNKSDSDREFSTQLHMSANVEQISGLIESKAGRTISSTDLSLSTLFSSSIDDAFHTYMKDLNVGTKIKGSAGIVRPFALEVDDRQTNNNDYKFAGTIKSNMPRASLGSWQLGEQVLAFVKDDLTAKEVGNRLLRDSYTSDDDFRTDVNQAFDLLEKAGYYGKDGDIYYSQFVRYPVVAGGNHAVMAIEGVKRGTWGFSINRGFYDKYLGGDWDGDMVQQLELSTGLIKGKVDTVIKQLEVRAKERALNEYGSAGIKRSSSEQASTAEIGRPLGLIQEMSAFSEYQRGSINEDFISRTFTQTIDARKKVATVTREEEAGKLQEDDPLYVNIEVSGEGKPSSLVLFDMHNKEINTYGTLGNGEDNTIKAGVKYETGGKQYRTYLVGKGSNVMTIVGLEDIKAGGSLKIVAAKNGVIVSPNQIEKLIDPSAGIQFDDAFKFLNGKSLTSLYMIDRFIDPHSVLNVKLQAADEAAKSPMLTEDNLAKVVAGTYSRIRLEGTGSLNLQGTTPGGRFLANNYDFTKTTSTGLSILKEFSNSMLKRIQNGDENAGLLSLSNWKSLNKWTKSSIPSDRASKIDMLKALGIAAKMSDVNINKLNPIIKGIVNTHKAHIYSKTDNNQTILYNRLNGFMDKSMSDLYFEDNYDPLTNSSHRNWTEAALLLDKFTRETDITSKEGLRIYKRALTEVQPFYDSADLDSFVKNIADLATQLKGINGVVITEEDVRGFLDKLKKDNIEFKPSLERMNRFKEFTSTKNIKNGIIPSIVKEGKLESLVSVESFTNKMLAMAINADESNNLTEKSKYGFIAGALLSASDHESQRLSRYVLSGLTSKFTGKIIEASGSGEIKLGLFEEKDFKNNTNRIPVVFSEYSTRTNTELLCRR